MEKLEFTEEELSNLAVFLQRTQLNGAEVPAYVKIVKRINDYQLSKIPQNPEVTTTQSASKEPAPVKKEPESAKKN